jgi:hypothetical protein
MKRLLELINKYWGALLVLGGLVSTVVTFAWNFILLPQVDGHIDSRVLKMANDSLGIMIDQHMIQKGGGFRGALADSTGMKKEKVVGVLAKIIKEEEGRVRKLEDEVDYQHGYNFFILKNIVDKVEHNGVTFWLPMDGNVYYQDMYGLVWDAKYDAYDDCYYYYPNYSNGERLKCD